MSQPAPPGWYDDPHKVAYQRWWDGKKWTSYTAAPPQPQSRSDVARDHATAMAIRSVGLGFAILALTWYFGFRGH